MSELPTLSENQKIRRQQRRFIKDGSTPAGALTWRGNRSRGVVMRLWRTSVSTAFSSRPRCLRIAWALEWLFRANGYAYPTDSFLGKELSMSVDHVQEALKDLERGNAIIRASVFVNRQAERRIWPNSAIIPPDARGAHTPRQQGDIPPDARGQTIQKEKAAQRAFLSSTVLAARRSAELAEEKRKARESETEQDSDPSAEAA